MRIRHIALAIIALAFTQPAMAASKQEVAQAGCMSLEQARAKHKGAHLRYRQINNEQCWYDPMTFAKKSGVTVRVAGEGVVPSTLAADPRESRATPSESVRGQPATRIDNPNDDLDEIFLLLCGGPCPQLANPPGYLLRRK